MIWWCGNVHSPYKIGSSVTLLMFWDDILCILVAQGVKIIPIIKVEGPKKSKHD